MLNTVDVLTELDVLALDNEALVTFGNSPAVVSANLAAKRTHVVQDWLYSALVKGGYSPAKHSVRYAAEKVLGLTGSTFTDFTEAANDNSLNDLDLSTILAAPTDALYVGMAVPARGLWMTMLSSLNVTSMTASYAYWNGSQWAGFNSLVDGTINSLVPFGQGGRVTWSEVADWAARPLNNDATWRFWLRVQTTAAPGARLTHTLPIRRSRLTAPAALKTLALLYGESWGVQAGEWRQKSEVYHRMADEALAGALRDLAEFVTEPEQAVTPATVQKPDPSLFTLERG